MSLFFNFFKLKVYKKKFTYVIILDSIGDNMNKGKKVLKNVLFILIVIIVLIIIYFVYTSFTGKDNVFNKIVNSVNNENVNNDNYNGIYVYKDYLEEAVSPFAGCTVNSLDQYIYVNGSNYSIYDYTCMGTYLVKSGNTTELDFKFDNDKKTYYLEIDGKTYNKDINIFSIVPGNVVVSKLRNINVSTYQFIMEYAEFENNYFTVNSNITGMYHHKMNIVPNMEDGSFEMTISYDYKSNVAPVHTVYSLHVNDNKSFPDLILVYNRIVLIEKNKNDKGLYNYNLKVFDKNDGIIYSLEKLFPITVNNNQLSLTDNSVYIKYNELARNYDLLLGFDNNFCSVDSDSDDVAYYYFTVDYDRKNLTLGNPVYQRTYLKKDGCEDYKKIVGD